MPKTRILMVRTAHATYPFLWMDFGDGHPELVLQQWVASPPALEMPVK